MLLREGRYQEETIRDLDAAIATYSRVREQADVEARSIAEADLAIARCLARKGRHSEARQRLKVVISEYAHFAGLVTDARRLLQRMPAADPAAFMPPDTLIYAELTQPWAHMERIAHILAEADVSKLLRAHSSGQSGFPVAAIFHQFMINNFEEMKKFEALGVGMVDFAVNPPGESEKQLNPFLLVLFPGQSQLIRSLIENMTESMQKVDHLFECDVFEVPGTKSQLYLAVHDEVFLLGSPAQTVIDAVRRRYGEGEKSLAANEDFRRQAAARRQDSAIIIYGNLSRMVPIIKSREDRGDFDNLNTILDLDTVDYLMARVDLNNDRLVIEATALMDEDRPNAFYEFWKSAYWDEGACRYVPQDAVSALSIGVEDGQRKWEQLFDIAGTLYRARGDRDSGFNPIQVVQALESVLGVDKGRKVLGALRSLTFVLSQLDASAPPGFRGIMADLVLIANTTDPDLVERALGAMADASARRVQGDDGAVAEKEPLSFGQAKGVRYRFSDEEPAWYVVRQGTMVLFSYSQVGVLKCLEARQLGQSILDLPLEHPLRRVPKNVHKFGFFRVDRILQRLAKQHRINEAAPDQALPTVFWTIEKPHEMTLRIEVNDLPKVIRGLTEVMLSRLNQTAAELPDDGTSVTISTGG